MHAFRALHPELKTRSALLTEWLREAGEEDRAVRRAVQAE
jgi:hypothetical protein